MSLDGLSLDQRQSEQQKDDIDNHDDLDQLRHVFGHYFAVQTFRMIQIRNRHKAMVVRAINRWVVESLPIQIKGVDQEGSQLGENAVAKPKDAKDKSSDEPSFVGEVFPKTLEAQHDVEAASQAEDSGVNTVGFELVVALDGADQTRHTDDHGQEHQQLNIDLPFREQH